MNYDHTWQDPSIAASQPASRPASLLSRGAPVSARASRPTGRQAAVSRHWLPTCVNQELVQTKLRPASIAPSAAPFNWMWHAPMPHRRLISPTRTLRPTRAQLPVLRTTVMRHARPSGCARYAQAMDGARSIHLKRYGALISLCMKCGPDSEFASILTMASNEAFAPHRSQQACEQQAKYSV